MCITTALSQRRSCGLTGLSLSTCRYEAQRPAAEAHLSGHITALAPERIYQGTLLRWHRSAGVLAPAVSGSYCTVKAFMLITSACTAFII